MCRRWDGDFLTASALIKCGVLGRLVEFESHFDRYRPALKMGWKEDADLPGAGVLFDLGGCSTAVGCSTLYSWQQVSVLQCHQQDPP